MKDLKRKIEKLQERLDSVKEEIEQKYAAADEIEDQIDNLEYGVIKRREGMELLQNVADDKLGLLNYEFQKHVKFNLMTIYGYNVIHEAENFSNFSSFDTFNGNLRKY